MICAGDQTTLQNSSFTGSYTPSLRDSLGETHWGHTFVFRPLITHIQTKHLRRENLRLATVAALLAFTTLDETKLWPYEHPTNIKVSARPWHDRGKPRREMAAGDADDDQVSRLGVRSKVESTERLDIGNATSTRRRFRLSTFPPRGGFRSRKQRKRPNVFRTDNREVPSIQRGDDVEAQSFCKRYVGRIDGSQGEVAISSYELRDPYPIAREDGTVVKFPRRDPQGTALPRSSRGESR